jgi:hypothetical protein
MFQVFDANRYFLNTLLLYLRVSRAATAFIWLC